MLTCLSAPLQHCSPAEFFLSKSQAASLLAAQSLPNGVSFSSSSQVGLPGGVSEADRQVLLAPLRMLDGILEVGSLLVFPHK